MNIPYYRVVDDSAGRDEWITMLHGASQHGGLFNAQIDHFRSRYRLLLIDLPGHGRSSPMAGPYGQAEYTAAVLSALDAAGVQRTHLWGTHTGSAVGLLIASNRPDRIASLILEGAVLPGMPMPYVAHALARARLTAQERGVAAARAEWFEQCKWFDVIRSRPSECRTEAHWQLLMAFAGSTWLDTSQPAEVPSLVDKLPLIEHPVLLVNGEFDVAEFLGVADVLASRLPRVQRVIVTGAGGFPLWEFPATVNNLVNQFLEAQN